MHHHRVSLFGHTLQQLSDPPISDADLFRGLPLRDAPILSAFQPFQFISFLLAHRDSFHPPALWLSRGTFYLAQSGTFHLAATCSTPLVCPRVARNIGGCWLPSNAHSGPRFSSARTLSG